MGLDNKFDPLQHLLSEFSTQRLSQFEISYKKLSTGLDMDKVWNTLGSGSAEKATYFKPREGDSFMSVCLPFYILRFLHPPDPWVFTFDMLYDTPFQSASMNTPRSGG